MAGAQPNPDGPKRSTTTDLGAKRYVAAGDRAYVIGSEDGRFPPTGWHIRGEMGGVWAHPIKLLDGYWFALDDQWIPQAQNFTAGAGYVQMQFPTTDGLNVTRTEFSPDGSPVVLVGLTLRNPDSTSRSVKVTMDARSEVMAAYPWGWTTPNAKEFNGPDEGSYDPSTGTLAFKEPGKPWYAAVRASVAPYEGLTGSDYWGPVPETERTGYLENGNGTGGSLRWNLSVGGGQERTLWVAIAGSHTSQSEATSALSGALNDPESLLSQKVNSRLALLNKTRVDLPDEKLQEAFDWGKLNMADLTRTVKDMQVRDVEEGKAYPSPSATISSATGIGAGFPDYPWHFGTDGAYTAYPLLVSGQWDTIKEHLRTIRDVSRIVNGSTGKVVHEVVTDGSVYWGDNDDPGNTNETAQFATAVEQVWRWTGDSGFRDQMYPFVKDGMRYITSASGCPPQDPPIEGTCDDDNDGWPEGYGMVERTGMGEEKLDNTAYTWRALRALEAMAKSKRDSQTAAWAGRKADAMEGSFDAAWWMPNLSLYADSLDDPGNVQLQQKHWINATPMEVLLAPENRANAALDTLESPTFTDINDPNDPYDSCGLYHTGVGGGPDGNGEMKCWTLPNSVMAVAEANYGRLGEDEALFYMDAIAGQLGLEMPGALPEISPSLVPSPGYDPFVDFRERAMFMQAWSSYGVQWPVIHHFLGILPDVPTGSLTVVPDVPESWPGLSVQNLKVGSGTVAASASHDGNRYTTEVSASARWKLTIGHTLPEGAQIQAVTLDGQPADYRAVETTRGLEVRVGTNTNQRHTLVVTTG
ncbi:MAG: glycogen debranching protein [Actinomycetota bacterium]|nr:glycogen debranching protein [Actinomycetota bacterium]